MMKRFWESIKGVSTADLRSLACMRIGVGVTLIIDLLIRLSNLEAHYTNKGILPLEPLFRYAWNDYYFSFFTITGNWTLQLFLFLINLLLAFFLMAGYRTRLTTILCWVFILSLHNRNPLIHQGGDDLLRMVLFWGMFLPWGTCFSVDSLKSTALYSKDKNYFSITILAYVLQIGFVYYFSALLKTSPEWTSEYTALYYALSFDQIVLPFGKLIYPYESLLKFLTALVYYMEFLLPFLLLIPFYTQRLRIVFFLLISFLHIGISLCLNVGLFPLIGIVSCIGLLPFEPIKKILHLSRLNFHLLFSGIRNVCLRLFPRYSDDSFSFFRIRSLKILFVTGILLYILNWNLWTVGKPVIIPSDNSIWIGAMLRVDQHWGMFAPAVFKDDGWFIFAGKTQDGVGVDILTNNSEISYRRAAAATGVFEEDRWRKFSENILFAKNHHYRSLYCFYLMQQWNDSHSEKEKLRSLDLIYMKESSLPGYKVMKTKKELLCSCTTNQ